jgi:ribulose-bisphosphate carboxylase large chain
MSTRLGGKSYTAGVKRCRFTYWKPECAVKEIDILACFKIAPQAGVDRGEAAAPFFYRHSFGVFT